MKVHHCHAAMKRVFEKLFTGHECRPAPIVPISELVLYFSLFFMLFWRHRESILPHSKAAQRLRETGVSTASKTPYEVLIMLAVTSTHWLTSTYIPLAKSLLEEPAVVLGGLNLRDATLVFMILYVVFLEWAENRHWNKNVIQIYYKNKAAGTPAVASAMEPKLRDEKQAIVVDDIEAEAGIEDTTPMLATSEKDKSANDDGATPQAQPRGIFRRIHAKIRAQRRERDRRCAVPLTPMVILSRMYTRAFFKSSLTLIFLFMAGEQLCVSEPAKYLDAEDNPLLMMMVVSSMYMVRAVQLLLEGYRFQKAEVN